jgi:two-component system response regulator GlrR
MSVNFDYQSQSNVLKVRQKSNINSSDLRAELGIIGENPAILLCFDLACRYARCDAPICIFGSTGTGKEVFARAIHYISKRQALPFIPVNCGALPDTLFESELFGVVKGAFTGANADRAGLVEVAKGGTLFLDEVDCLSPKAQVTLLRFLQQKEYRRVGSPQLRHADVRIVAATNTSLDACVAAGNFREDLVFRLDVCSLSLPSLDERRDDIPLLAAHFLEGFAAHYKRDTPRLTPAAASWLMSRSWHGNLRQLENVMHRAIAVCSGSEIGEELLLEIFPGPPSSPASRNDEISVLDTGPLLPARRRAAMAFEYRYLRELLAATGGNVSEAARRAGTERRAMGRMLKRHGLGKG